MSRISQAFLVATALLSFTATDALAQRARPTRTRTARANVRTRLRTGNVSNIRRTGLNLNQTNPEALRSHLRTNGVKLSSKDLARLDSTAQRFASEIRRSYTPVVDLHITEATTNAGVRFKKTSNPRYGTSGPTVFEISGTEKTGGMVNLVLSGGASGHVMQQQYGGRPMSTVEQYGKTDTVYLTHKGPGMSSSQEVVKVQSRGLVTQEGFTMKLSKGEHNFFYFRGGPAGRSGGEGSEPELRHVKLIVK